MALSGPSSPSPRRLLAVQVYLDVDNFGGEWEPMEAYLEVPRDPLDSGPGPSLIVHKLRRRITEPINTEGINEVF